MRATRRCAMLGVSLSSIDDASLSDALSKFIFMVIDTANIRNVAFETISLAELQTEDPVPTSPA